MSEHCQHQRTDAGGRGIAALAVRCCRCKLSDYKEYLENVRPNCPSPLPDGECVEIADGAESIPESKPAPRRRSNAKAGK